MKPTVILVVLACVASVYADAQPRSAVRSLASGCRTPELPLLATLTRRTSQLAPALRLRGGRSAAGAVQGPAKAPKSSSFKVFVAFAGWYLMSIVYSVLNKQVLSVWKFPFTFSAVQLLVGALWICTLWLPVTGTGASLREPPSVSGDDVKQLMPIASFLALGHALSTVAPAYGTVAFTNVVKTLEPLFTCALSAVFLGQIFSPLVYLSLLPVIAGVVLASTNEISFSMISLVSGLASNLMFALRALSAKRVMSSSLGRNLSPSNMYGLLTLIALALLLPVGLAVEGGQLAAGTAATIAELGGVWPFVRLLLMTGVSHYVYNECAFVALSTVHPVTHAVANTVKRIAVIIVTVIYFGDKFTMAGAAGSTISILGVFLYSLAKARDGRLAAAKAVKA